MKQLFPEMYDRPDKWMPVPAMAYWIFAFLILPTWLPLIADGLFNDLVGASWVDIALHIINALVVFAMYRSYAVESFLNVQLDTKKFFIAVGGASLIAVCLSVWMYFFSADRYGLINNIAENLGGERFSYFLESVAFRPLYILSSNWQDFGWSAIIYIAALSNADPQQHEAAILDGASRWQRVIHVDLPAIMPMVSVMLIMSIGGLMGVGYEKALLMQTDSNLTVSELIATYVYKKGLTGVPDQAYATAIGLFNSVINVVLLIIANTTSKKFSENSLW